jgi:hypothetical protein
VRVVVILRKVIAIPQLCCIHLFQGSVHHVTYSSKEHNKLSQQSNRIVSSDMVSISCAIRL